MSAGAALSALGDLLSGPWPACRRVFVRTWVDVYMQGCVSLHLFALHIGKNEAHLKAKCLFNKEALLPVKLP